MKLQALALGLAAAPGALAWGSLGHITTAYIASHFVANTTEAHLMDLLNSDEFDYLARVATWADSVRYTKWGRFTKNFHFIDAHDDPPSSCNVDYERDCKADGCVISALANYTTQVLDAGLPRWRRAQAAKFVVHFVGDLHQPLHNENVALGGNRIYVEFGGKRLNLHHVWDSSILEKYIGGMHGSPYDVAHRWAGELVAEINDGKFAAEKEGWLKGLDINSAEDTAMAWSSETNKLICSHVLPEGPENIKGQELGTGEYFDKAGPALEKQVAQAGYRMAAWLDQISAQYKPSTVGKVELKGYPEEFFPDVFPDVHQDVIDEL